MVWRVLVWVLALARGCEGGTGVGLRERVASRWCGELSTGVGYSFGEYFPCGSRSQLAKDLEGVTLRIGIIEGDDFEYDCSSAVVDGRLHPKDSYSVYILLLLRDILRFDVRFLSSASWGYFEGANHTWRGLAGLLAANLTDMAACHWTTTEHLFDIAEFLLPTLTTTKSFVFLPENLPLTGDVFVEALSRKLWAFFLLSIFLLIVFYWISTRTHWKLRPDHEPWSWDEVVLWAVAAISQQSYSRHPRGSSCRTMFFIGYMITYLLFTGFAAGITSLLALQNRQNHLTLEDVARMKLNLLLLEEEYNLDIFQNHGPDFGYLNLGENKGENLNDIFRKITRTNHLGFGSTVTLLNYLTRKIDAETRSGFAVVQTPHSVRRKAFLVQKSFPHRRLFNFWLLRLRETGFLDLGKRRYLRVDTTGRSKPSTWFSAGLENVFSGVVFIFAGWALSVGILLAEILSGKLRNTWGKRLRRCANTRRPK